MCIGNIAEKFHDYLRCRNYVEQGAETARVKLRDYVHDRFVVCTAKDRR